MNPVHGISQSSSAKQGGNVKFASAHDLRRSFGDRWAKVLLSQLLKELMRHEDIETTMRYYIGEQAQATAAAVWAAYRQSAPASGVSLGGSSDFERDEEAKKP